MVWIRKKASQYVCTYWPKKLSRCVWIQTKWPSDITTPDISEWRLNTFYISITIYFHFSNASNFITSMKIYKTFNVKPAKNGGKIFDTSEVRLAILMIRWIFSIVCLEQTFNSSNFWIVEKEFESSSAFVIPSSLSVYWNALLFISFSYNCGLVLISTSQIVLVIVLIDWKHFQKWKLFVIRSIKS